MVEFSYPDVNMVEIDDSAIIEFVKSNYNPNDVFPESELESWAESNGFVREE